MAKNSTVSFQHSQDIRSVEMVFNSIFQPRASLVAQMVRNLPAMRKTRV